MHPEQNETVQKVPYSNVSKKYSNGSANAPMPAPAPRGQILQNCAPRRVAGSSTSLGVRPTAPAHAGRSLRHADKSMPVSATREASARHAPYGSEVLHARL